MILHSFCDKFIFKGKLLLLLLLSSTRQYLLISKGELISLWLFLYIRHSQIRSNVTFLFTLWSINVSEAIWGMIDIMDFFICSLTCVDRMVHERQEPTLFQAVNSNIKPCANDGNVIECYMLRPVCTPCYMLLRVVASQSVWTALPKRTQQCRLFRVRTRLSSSNSVTFSMTFLSFPRPWV